MKKRFLRSFLLVCLVTLYGCGKGSVETPSPSSTPSPPIKPSPTVVAENGTLTGGGEAELTGFLQGGEWVASLSPYGNSDEEYLGFLSFIDENRVKYEMGTIEGRMFVYDGSYDVVLTEGHESGFAPGTLLLSMELEWTIQEGVDPRFDLIYEINGAFSLEMPNEFELCLQLADGDPLYNNRFAPDIYSIMRDYTFNRHVETSPGNSSPLMPANLVANDYLAGNWAYYYDGPLRCFYNGPPAGCHLLVAEDMRFSLNFYELESGEGIACYSGKAALIRVRDNEESLPDALALYFAGSWNDPELFWFEEATLHEGKRMMLLTPMDGSSPFFYPLNSTAAPRYMIFARETGERGTASPRIGDVFDARLWRMDGDKGLVWLDDVEWDDDLLRYDNPVRESVAYPVAADAYIPLAPEAFYAGAFFRIEADARGEIIAIYAADWAPLYEPERRNEVLYYIEMLPEVKGRLDLVMKLLATGETTMLDGATCYDVLLGTEHDEYFARDTLYTVNPDSGEIYEYDPLGSSWKLLMMENSADH